MLVHLAPMYPPKCSDSNEEVVSGLLASLSRAGLELVDVLPDGEGGYVARLFSTPSSTEMLLLRRYAKMYVKEAGWVLTSMKTKKSRLLLKIEKA